MKGYECDKCGTELEYEQYEGMRLKHEDKDGNFYLNAHCPGCDEDFRSYEK